VAIRSFNFRPTSAAARRIRCWRSTINLDPHQVKQAETQKIAADSAVTARIPEAYQWLLVPVQETPQSAIGWQAFRLTGFDTLAVRVGQKLRNDELLLTGFAPSRLQMELDRVPLWRLSAGAQAGGDSVAINHLVEDFGRYLYLPRLKEPFVLLGAIRDGLGLLTWEKDSFAYADSYDEGAGRYRGLRGGQQVFSVDTESPALLVKSEIARKQIDAETTPEPPPVDGPRPIPPGLGPEPVPPAPPEAAKLKRFHGTVELDPARVGRDASRIADEVISHLSGLVGANVTVTLEFEAKIPDGAPDTVVRTVTENARTLKFKNQGFEKE